MKIKKIELPEDFKRFKKLTVSGLPETAKLVVLVGPNGCGKSSLFDAISVKAQYSVREQSMGVQASRPRRPAPFGRAVLDSAYYSRDPNRPDANRPDSDRAVFDINIVFHGTQDSKIEWKKAVYVRSAYRNVPSVEADRFTRLDSALDEPRVVKMIDNDEAAEQNYTRLFSQVLESLFESDKSSMTVKKFREEALAEIRDPFKSLFDDLVLNKLRGFSAGGETLRFDKGDVKGFAYENLSGGEKAAFDLILDFVVKRQEFDDTVFCIDEPEAHIAVGIQGKLLDVIYRLVPDKCQLWIATHSIGMMRKAYELYKKDAGKVVFLDFNGRNFDESQEIKPAKMSRALWESMHDVVLDDLADLVAPKMLYICESTQERSFDAKCYNKIFSSEYPDAEFVSVGSKNDVKKEVKRFVPIMQKAMPGQKIFGVRDRDNATDEEVQKARDEGVRVLSRVCIEAYLLHDDVLTAFCRDPRHVLLSETLNAIKGIRDKNKHNPKRAAGAIRGHLIDEHKRGHLIGEHKGLQIGDDNAGFLLHLADLVTPKMPIYQELERDIFGNGNM